MVTVVVFWPGVGWGWEEIWVKGGGAVGGGLGVFRGVFEVCRVGWGEVMPVFG